MKGLHARLDKAEDDRMDKYYKQVGQLQDWVVSHKEQIEDNRKMVESLTFFYN